MIHDSVSSKSIANLEKSLPVCRLVAGFRVHGHILYILHDYNWN